MSLFSKQKIFCNNCGKELYVEYNRLIGRECKVCSIECLREYELKRAKSILGEQ